MANTKIKDPKAILCFIMAILCLSGVMAFFIIGGIFYSSEHPKVKNYDNSTCTVDSSSYKVYQCKARYYQYTCYGPIWYVHYGINETFARVETDKRYRYSSLALDEAKHYQINHSYSCWYDRRNPSVAQWNKPSTRIAIILLCCGGLAVLLGAMFAYFTIVLVKQQTQQNSYNNMSYQAYPNTWEKS